MRTNNFNRALSALAAVSPTIIHYPSAIGRRTIMSQLRSFTVEIRGMDGYRALSYQQVPVYCILYTVVYISSMVTRNKRAVILAFVCFEELYATSPAVPSSAMQ